jgi:hypothetical protein
MYPADTRIDGVPALILGGEYDLPVPEAVSRMALGLFTDATYVGLAAAGHDPQFWSECGRVVSQRFITMPATRRARPNRQVAGGCPAASRPRPGGHRRPRRPMDRASPIAPGGWRRLRHGR